MVKKLLAAAVVLGVACQAIVGIDDKQLDPKYGSGGASEAGEDVPGGSGPTGADPRPPVRPFGPAAPSGKGATRWFAARSIFLGTVDPVTKKKDSTAWRRIGHNIDGECTTSEISNSDTSATCKKPQNASGDSLADGDDCRDNASGRLLSLAIQYLSQDFELGLQAELNTGDAGTYLIKLEDLDNGPDDPYVPAALYVTVPRDPANKPPLWNGADIFNVDMRTVNLTTDSGTPDAGATDAKAEGGGASDAKTDAVNDAVDEVPAGGNPWIDNPRYTFPKGYMKNNVWVSGDFDKSPMVFPLFVLDRMNVVDAETLTLAVELTPTHDKAVASMLSAVASTEALQKNFQAVGLEITNCNALYTSLLMSQFILPARDLANKPPSFQAGAQICDAESMGFAFDWQPVQPPIYVLPSKDAPPQCGGDAGL